MNEIRKKLVIPFSAIPNVFLATSSLLGIFRLLCCIHVYFQISAFSLQNRSQKKRKKIELLPSIYATDRGGNLVHKFKTIKFGKTAQPRITAHIFRIFPNEMEQTIWCSNLNNPLTESLLNWLRL